MDGVDPDLVDTAEAALAAEPGVTEVRSVKMRWIGHRLHADAELEIDPATSLDHPHGQALDATDQVMFVGCEANAHNGHS
jgi:divalent metal cation (Fe/Co/Zn/Cd) transporter